MNLQKVITELELHPYTKPIQFEEIIPECGYASDLLSCVMAGAKRKSIWVTLQAHGNIIAIASLLELSAIIITEGAVPDAATVEKADEEGVILLGTDKSSFYIVGKLWELGFRCQPEA